MKYYIEKAYDYIQDLQTEEIWKHISEDCPDILVSVFYDGGYAVDYLEYLRRVEEEMKG